MKRKVFFVSLILFLLSGTLLYAQTATPAEPIDPKVQLEALIKQRADDLKKINDQMEQTKQNLETTKSQTVNLQQEVRGLDSNIKALQLSIKSDEVTNQKLGLEIESMGYDMIDIKKSIEAKQDAIAASLTELQKKGNPIGLIELLKSNSITDGIMEVQNLQALRDQLSIDIASLSNMNKELDKNITEVAQKKSEIEERKQAALAKKSVIEDQKEEKKVVLTLTKSKESLYQQQLNDLQKQQNAIEEEIGKMEDQLKQGFDNRLLPTRSTGRLAWPVQLISDGGKGRITQHFGEYSRLYKSRAHNGLDIGLPVGTPVFAADDGVVLASDNNDRSAWSKYQYGRYVMIKHSDNLATLYGHLSRQLVSKGDIVKRGQLIGYSGNTGYSTGAHLHFGLYYAPSIEMKSVPPAAGLVPIGVVINPEDYL